VAEARYVLAMPSTPGVVLSAGTVVTGDAVARPGWVALDGATIRDTGSGRPPGAAAVTDLGTDATLVPGFVDMHTHGGGGGSFPGADPDQVATAIAFHRRHGTTTMIASLVTAGPDALLADVRALADRVAAGDLAGIHLEGPWLSERRRGAHDVALLRDPDPGELANLLDAGAGAIRMVTFAPERDGALDAIRAVVAAGAVAAVGHTDATYDVVRDALDAGATAGTHLFNAMRPLHHREPGPVVALLDDPRVTVEVILDGHHVHPALYAMVTRTAGPGRVALVTDAMVAAGMPDGDYRLGDLDVTVAAGLAVLTGTSTIAGSTTTMDVGFRTAVHTAGGPGSDAALLRAADQTSATPARTLGLPHVGSLRAGSAADAVVLDADLAVSRVLRAGRWITVGP
jgi:N-acetylglucosamine-6-phosphate deacetylase